MPVVDRVADGLPDEVLRDREAAQAVLGEQLAAAVGVGVVRQGRVHVEVVAPAGELEAVEAPLGRLLGQRRERQVGPLAGEERHGSCHVSSLLSGWRKGAAMPREARIRFTPAASYSRAVSAGRPSSTMSASSSSRRAIESSADRPNFVESSEATVRCDDAIAAWTRVGERPPGRGEALLERHAGGRDERGLDVEPGDELGRPATADHPQRLVDLAGDDDDVDLLRLQLERDRRRVRHERERPRRVSLEVPRKDEVRRRGVEEHGRAVLDELGRMDGDRLFLRQRLPQPLGPVGGDLDPRRPAARRASTAAHALDQAVGGEPLEVAVDGDRRDAVVAGELRHGRAAFALDALEDP